MEKSNTTFWLIVGGLSIAILYLWEKSRAQSAALAGANVSNPVARSAGYVAGTSDSYLSKVPLVGSVLSNALNQPVTNVTGGDVKGTVHSATSGGLSDLAPSVSQYVDPVEWFW